MLFDVECWRCNFLIREVLLALIHHLVAFDVWSQDCAIRKTNREVHEAVRLSLGVLIKAKHGVHGPPFLLKARILAHSSHRSTFVLLWQFHRFIQVLQAWDLRHGNLLSLLHSCERLELVALGSGETLPSHSHELLGLHVIQFEKLVRLGGDKNLARRREQLILVGWAQVPHEDAGVGRSFLLTIAFQMVLTVVVLG